jgi:repressor LexA
MILTKRQKQFLDYISGYIGENGFAPTLEEIGEHFELNSLATVHKHLANLESKGLIRRKWNFSRAIELVDAATRPGAVELPLLGFVAAGAPIETIETDDTFIVPEQLLGRGTSFVLRVRGDSMIDDGICDGDYIVVERRDRAVNGETVVALVRGEATVKRFQQEGDRIRLLPANERMAPIEAPAADVEVRGVVVAVMRKYGCRAA